METVVLRQAGRGDASCDDDGDDDDQHLNAEFSEPKDASERAELRPLPSAPWAPP